MECEGCGGPARGTSRHGPSASYKGESESPMNARDWAMAHASLGVNFWACARAVETTRGTKGPR